MGDKHVFSTAKAIVAVDGATVRLYENEVWAADDPVVKAHPDNFSAEPVKIRRTPGPATPTVESATTDPEVEDTTAEPGAKRRTTKRA